MKVEFSCPCSRVCSFEYLAVRKINGRISKRMRTAVITIVNVIPGFMEMAIGNRTWIGQQCFLHSAGGLEIGSDVGVGPGVRILTSLHEINGCEDLPIIHRPIKFLPVVIGDGCDIGANAVVLPGVSLGRNVQVGAGAVVSRSFEDETVIAGVPARILKR